MELVNSLPHAIQIPGHQLYLRLITLRLATVREGRQCFSILGTTITTTMIGMISLWLYGLLKAICIVFFHTSILTILYDLLLPCRPPQLVIIIGYNGFDLVYLEVVDNGLLHWNGLFTELD